MSHLTTSDHGVPAQPTAKQSPTESKLAQALQDQHSLNRYSVVAVQLRSQEQAFLFVFSFDSYCFDRLFFKFDFGLCGEEIGLWGGNGAENQEGSGQRRWSVMDMSAFFYVL